MYKSALKSGYTSCKCPTCFEIAVSDDMSQPDLCLECEDAGCDGKHECRVERWVDDDVNDERFLGRDTDADGNL